MDVRIPVLNGENYNTIELNRNTLYYVTLKKKDVPTEYAPLEATVSVADWREGEAIMWSGVKLAQKNTPQIELVQKSVWNSETSDYDDAVTVSTSKLTAESSDNELKASVGNKKMKLTIKVKAGATGANITCPNLTSELGEIENQSNPEKEWDADNNLYQTWTIALNANAAKTADKTNNAPLVFNISNQLDATQNLTLKLNPWEIQHNPLYWVSEFNLATIKGVNGASATTFYTTQSTYASGSNTTRAYMFSFAQALTTAKNGQDGSTGSAKMDKYHQPTFEELVSIVPSNNSNGSSINILGITNTKENPYSYSEIACNIGGNPVEASTSYFYKVATKEYYAIRFVGTDYASAWHYKWQDAKTGANALCAGLLIESFLIDARTADQAKETLKTLATSSVWETDGYNVSSTKANLRPTDDETIDEAYCQRFFPANGACSSAGTANKHLDGSSFYWSSRSNYCWYLHTESDNICVLPHSDHGFSVRLFYD